MSNKNNGGPAFPCIVSGDDTVHDSNGYLVGHRRNGMTLRDYFAVHAPINYDDAKQWLEVHGGECVGPWPTSAIIETICMLQLEYADTMLAARESQS